MTTKVDDVLDLKSVEAQMQATHKLLEQHIEKANAEVKEVGAASQETKSAVDKLSEKLVELGDKIADLQQKQAAHFDGQEEQKSIGQMFVDSDEIKSLINRRTGSARIELKTAIVNAVPSMVQPMVPGDRLNIVSRAPDRMLKIRDVIPGGRTSSNHIWFPKEDTFTNSAAVVVGGSPTISAENVTKPESALTFTNGSADVVTIAHWIPCSKQVLADSPFLQSYVDNRLLYGLKLKEETELLTGTGLLGTISGINTQATAYAQGDSPQSYTTSLDLLRDAKRQAAVSNYDPSVIILNTKDWSDIELSKDTSGQYLFSNPQGVADPVLWGMRVIVSNSQTAGKFTVLAPDVCQIFDREDASVTMSFEEGNNFTKNMVTILAEERLAFVVYQTGGIIYGTLGT